MRLKRFFWIAPTALLLIVWQTFRLNFPVPLAMSPVAAQTSDVRKAEADRLYEQGNQQTNIETAIQFYQQALNIYRQIREYDMAQRVLAWMGTRYRERGDYTKAIEYYQQWLALAREIKDWKEQGLALNHLGFSYRMWGQYAKAIKYYEQSLALARERKDFEEEIRVLTNIVVAYPVLGENAKAIECYQRWLEIAREIKNRQEEQKSLVELAWFYHQLGNDTKAIEFAEQALAVAREINDSQALNARLTSLGLLYVDAGNYIKAIDYYQQALAIARETKDGYLIWSTLKLLGNAHRKLGNYTKAIDYYQQSLTVARANKESYQEVLALDDMVMGYVESENYVKAIEYAQQSLALKRKNNGSKEGALRYLGLVYLYSGDYAKAIDYIRQSLALTQARNNPPSDEALYILGYALYYSGDLAAAEKVFFDRIRLLESLRAQQGNFDAKKVSMFEEQTPAYQSLQEILIAQNKPETALEIAERGRARAFVELIARRLSPTPIEPAQVSPPNLEQIKQTAKVNNTTLVLYSIISDIFKVEGKRQLREEALYIWVIKPTGEVTFRKADLKPLWQQQNTSLKDLVTTTRESIGVDDRSIFVAEVQHLFNEEEQTKNLQQLHQLLIAPITDLLPTDQNQRVTFVPQGELFLVPFAALQDTQGKYLIEKHTILTTPSIQVLELTHQQREKVKQAAVKDAVVVGNPTMPTVPPKYGEKPQQLASLKGAKQEAEAIAPLLNTKALTGDEATKATVLARLPGAKIVHLATHGLFDDFQGLQSAIALAPTSSDNGLLTASEILDLKLNADLVVLSACNTGRGRITGDGVIGLSRSLFIAGTPSVIVSLWSVPDAPTASLMSEFYTNLYQKKLDKAQALRQAMLKMMEKHRDNPRAWAAFTLIGEAQ
jgi:CHAT domain-containing protein/uncharacterized protein HemY